MKRDGVLALAAFAAGALLWGLLAALTHRREAWDSGLYWTVGLPASYAVAALLAWMEPRRSWRWAIIPFAGQATWMFAAAGIGNLAPLGLVFFAVLSIPGVFAAALVARRRRNQ